MIVGVDLGLSGGISCIGTNVQNGQVRPSIIHLIDMPVLSIKKGKSTKNIYDYNRIKCFFVNELAHLDFEVVYIEKTQPLQAGYRSQASHSLGLGEGFFIGLLGALDIPYEFVRSRKWQKYFGITGAKGDLKKQSYQVASQLFPTAELATPRGRKLDGRSDSLLIAEWGRRHLQGEKK